jgi:hypothetical protein
MRLLAFAALFACPVAAFAQSKPDRANPLDQIAGYKRVTIEGFTLLMSEEATLADASAYQLKPVAVLEKELKVVTKIMTAKQVETLKKLLIWVEWDEKTEVTNGRDGSAVAVYYGGHQASLLQQGKHPLKAKTVTVLSLKSLTEEHQPKRDSGRCVLLHELAHAVHDQLLGRDHAGIKAAFAQAMERKLYDKTQYVSTNEAEFFAETTSAYFDQLHHYPQTRDELKKHDPATHKLLESIWGTSKKPEATAAKPKGLLAENGTGKFDLGVKPTDLRFERTIHGPEFNPDDLKGRVTVVGFIGQSDLPVLAKLTQIHDELAVYGARVVAGPGQISDPNEWKKELAARQVSFTAVGGMGLREKQTPNQFVGQKASHTLVFAADGTCVFRGSGHDALPHARAAVGQGFAAKLAAGIQAKPMQPLTDILVSGQPVTDVLPKLTAVSRSSDEAASKRAKELLDTLTAPGQKALDEAKTLAKTDQVAAFILLEPLPVRFRGSPVGEKLSAAVDGLKNTIPVAAELKARTTFEPIKKLDAQIQAQPGGFNPADPAFRQRNAVSIAQLKAAVEQMKKKHPKAKATEQAEKLLQVYGG